MADTTVGFQFEAGALERVAAVVRPDDSALIAELRAGVDSAYETLIDRFEQPVFNLVSRLLDDSAEAPDVVQEVFLKVFRNIVSFRAESSLKTWIYRIAVNEARNHRRWFSRHRRQEVAIDAGPGESQSYADWIADPGRSPFDSTLDHETKALIESALAAVSPTFRSALVLREIEGLDYQEIAEVLEISLGTVKSRILRGRDALRKQLAGRMEGDAAMEWSPQLAE